MRYEKEWFGVWRDKVDAVALHHLKQSVLLKQADTGVFGGNSILPTSSGYTYGCFAHIHGTGL